MKTFCKYFAVPVAIGVIASVLCIIDAFLARAFVKTGNFMWVAFAIWTIFYGASINERIRGLIGIVIGFLVAIIMNLITASFTLNLSYLSISCLLGVLVINFAVMFLNHTKKTWTHSVTGVFAGIFLTFSGLGINLSPTADVKSAFLMLAIIVVYAILGLLCGFFSMYFTNKAKKKLETLEPTEENKQ